MTHPAADISEDRRYEQHIPALLDEAVPRVTSTWKWRESDVHLEHVGHPEAPVRMLLVHGAGGNSAAMWPYAAHLSQLGALVTVPDLPGYGKTTTRHPGLVRYGDWQELLADLVRNENDERPLVIMGASMGGMLAYDAAAATGLASRLVVTCLLDPRDPGVRERLTRHPALARLAGPALAMAAGPLANVRVAQLPRIRTAGRAGGIRRYAGPDDPARQRSMDSPEAQPTILSAHCSSEINCRSGRLRPFPRRTAWIHPNA